MRDSNKVAMVMLILFLTLVFVPSIGDERENKSKYLSIDKEEYEKGENITIYMVNDGNATNYPISSYLRIKNADTGRVVYLGPQLVQPAIPPKGYSETFTWNQTDIDGEQVPPGEYEATFLDHSETFKISKTGRREETKGGMDLFLRSTGLIGASLVVYVLVRNKIEKDEE